MHHKQESVAMLSSILPDKPPFYRNAATQDSLVGISDPAPRCSARRR